MMRFAPHGEDALQCRYFDCHWYYFTLNLSCYIDREQRERWEAFQWFMEWDWKPETVT